MIDNKKKGNLLNSGFCDSCWPLGKTKGKWKERQVPRSCLRTEKAQEHESDRDTGTGGFGNKRMSEDHPNDSIIKIGQNIEMSPGHLRRLAVTQIPMRSHLLKLVWKTLKWVKE